MGKIANKMMTAIDRVRFDRKLLAVAALLTVAATATVTFSLTDRAPGPGAASPPVVINETFYTQPDVQHFAQIIDGKVVRVEKIDSATLRAYPDRYPGLWIETYPDGRDRGTFAGIGHNYDAATDTFYPPRPFPSWTLDEQLKWNPPVPRPDSDGRWLWDEASLSWLLRAS